MSYSNYSYNAIYGENENTVKEIHTKMQKAIKENEDMEYVLQVLGITKEEIQKKGYGKRTYSVNCDDKKIKNINYKGKNLYYFEFGQESMNSEESYQWQEILEKLYPDEKTIGITYTAHTSGSPVITRKEAGLVELLFDQKAELQYAVKVYDERTDEDTDDLMNIEDTIKVVKRITGKEYKKEDFETKEAFKRIRDKLHGDGETTWLFVERLETWNTL